MAELTGPDAEHLVRVLRAEAGQIYEISDNERVYLAEIETARKSLVTFKVLEELPSPAPVAQVALYPALFKFDRFEWMVEKATELGVTSIHPFEAVRSERGLAQAAQKRRARWERIALEASQQSRRIRLPAVHETLDFEDVLTNEPNADLCLLLDEENSAPPIRSSLPRDISSADRICLLIGPEGGWIDEEREKAAAAGWRGCSLGSFVLRAETAAMAALSVVNAFWGR